MAVVGFGFRVDDAIRLAILTLALGGSRFHRIRHTPPPYSCRLLSDEQRKYAFGSCGVQVLERMRARQWAIVRAGRRTR
jgi:hypothetical protein